MLIEIGCTNCGKSVRLEENGIAACVHCKQWFLLNSLHFIDPASKKTIHIKIAITQNSANRYMYEVFEE